MKNEEIKNYILENNGITLNSDCQLNEKKGYCVSIAKYEYTTKDIDNVMIKLDEYLKIAKKNSSYNVGVWLDDGVFYIDISLVFKDKKKALEFGKNQHQLAIFDNVKGVSLYLNNYNFKTFYTFYKKINNDLKYICELMNVDDVVKYFNLKNKKVGSMFINNKCENNIRCYIDYELIQ